MSGRVFYVSEELAATPVDGEVLTNRWWTVHPERGLTFWYFPTGGMRSEFPSPQCNPNRRTAEYLQKAQYADHECRFVPVVFLFHAERAMREDKKAFAEGQPS